MPCLFTEWVADSSARRRSGRRREHAEVVAPLQGQSQHLRQGEAERLKERKRTREKTRIKLISLNVNHTKWTVALKYSTL